mgnify:CR=1 FL=1
MEQNSQTKNNADAIKAISDDYLKAADKEALQAEIDADVKALAEGAVADNGKKVFEYLYENNNAITNALENNRG